LEREGGTSREKLNPVRVFRDVMEVEAEKVSGTGLRICGT